MWSKHEAAMHKAEEDNDSIADTVLVLTEKPALR